MSLKEGNSHDHVLRTTYVIATDRKVQGQFWGPEAGATDGPRYRILSPGKEGTC